MTLEQPSFYAIIPAHVRYSKDLEMGAKLLYGEITALTTARNYCWATNEYFADLYEVEVRTVQRWLSSLKNLKFIIIKNERNGIHWQRQIVILDGFKTKNTMRQKCHPLSNSNNVYDATKMSPPHDKNVTHSITSSITRGKEEEEEGMQGEVDVGPPIEEPPTPLKGEAASAASFPCFSSPDKGKRKKPRKPPKEPIELTQLRPNVWLTPEQKEKYAKEFGQEAFEAMLNKLNFHKHDAGKETAATGDAHYFWSGSWLVDSWLAEWLLKKQKAPAASASASVEKKSIAARLEGKYTFDRRFGNFDIYGPMGLLVSFAKNDEEGIERWLNDRGL